MLYQVRNGDSPAIIARRYGVAMSALIAANPRKPTTVVAGVRTWRSLAPGETVSVPVAGFVGDAGTDAVHALIAAGDPCAQANAGWVCLAQKSLGIGADGKWGSGTATAAQKLVPSAPGGCNPRPAWWAPAGQVNCPAVLPTLPALPAPPPPAPAPAPLTLPAMPAIPGVPTCAPGQFWNPLTGACQSFSIPSLAPPAAPPVTPVSVTCPAGTVLNPLTGSCDPIPTSLPIPGSPTTCPPGQVFNPLTLECETPIVPAPAPVAPPPAAPSAQSLFTPALNAEVTAALSSTDPTVVNQAWLDLNRAAQSLGGADAAFPTVSAQLKALTQRLMAPPAPTPTPAPSPPAPSPTPGVPNPGPAQPIVTAPTKPGLSTGTIVAGAVGAVALVGVIAAASMSGGKNKGKRR